MRFFVLFFALLTACATARGPAPQEMHLEVNPAATGAGIKQAMGPHQAYWNPYFSNGKLLITIAGTLSRPKDYALFSEVATRLGYAVIGVDYPNSRITTDCLIGDNPKCFDQFRAEIYGGDPVSDLVQIDQANSLNNRIVNLLKYLAARDTRWQPFLHGDRVAWNKVVLAGHSQGAGHVAYIAKLHKVDRVIVMGGPQDHFGGKAAGWLNRRSLTPRDRYYSMLHRKDNFNSDYQLAMYKTLCACEGQERVVFVDKPWHLAHVSLIEDKEYAAEWARLLKPLN